jgi:hypothetical protein
MSERITPDKIPTDPAKFKQWADAACVDWPGELQVKAYRAWQWLEGRSFRSAEDQEAFLASYRRWAGC